MNSGWKRNVCNWNYRKCPQIADLCALKDQSVQKHISVLKIHNLKMGNRFHIAPQNARFVVYGIIKVTLLKIFWENTEKFLKTYWQIVNTMLFYVHKKTRTELKFGYFSLGSTV